MSIPVNDKVTMNYYVQGAMASEDMAEAQQKAWDRMEAIAKTMREASEKAKVYITLEPEVECKVIPRVQLNGVTLTGVVFAERKVGKDGVPVFMIKVEAPKQEDDKRTLILQETK